MKNFKMPGKSQGILRWMISDNPVDLYSIQLILLGRNFSTNTKKAIFTEQSSYISVSHHHTFQYHFIIHFSITSSYISVSLHHTFQYHIIIHFSITSSYISVSHHHTFQYHFIIHFSITFRLFSCAFLSA